MAQSGAEARMQERQREAEERWRDKRKKVSDSVTRCEQISLYSHVTFLPVGLTSLNPHSHVSLTSLYAFGSVCVWCCRVGRRAARGVGHPSGPWPHTQPPHPNTSSHHHNHRSVQPSSHTQLEVQTCVTITREEDMLSSISCLPPYAGFFSG